MGPTNRQGRRDSGYPKIADQIDTLDLSPIPFYSIQTTRLGSGLVHRQGDLMLPSSQCPGNILNT